MRINLVSEQNKQIVSPRTCTVSVLTQYEGIVHSKYHWEWYIVYIYDIVQTGSYSGHGVRLPDKTVLGSIPIDVIAS